MAGFLVSASTGAMGSLLQKLSTMLSDEYRLLKDVRGDIELLKAELEAMHAFLLVMADVEEPDHQEKLRVDVVRELSYDIEDKIDKFMVRMDNDSSSKSNSFRELFDKTMKKITSIKSCHKIAKDVKNIKSQVKEVSERYARYKIDESSKHRNEKIDPRVCAMYKDVSELVGIDGPRDKLVKWLSNEGGELPHHTKVISIVGYGGLGKTTLAKQVYDKLGAKYEYRAFVSISRSPDMTKIFRSILYQLRNQNCADRDPQLIIDQIRNVLKDKRYFVIIDDIWDIHTWRTLDCALLKNNCNSVIITTTRIHDVAKSCCSSQGDLVYKIQPLCLLDSKRLFFNRIFGCEEKCPSDLKEISEDILKKCGGLPLAINTISSLLATRKTKEEWNRIRSSIGFAQDKNSDIDAMNYILSLSYFDLPLHLRSCLLYVTMFPEDYEIGRVDLILLWISEGFIHGKDGDDLVQLGEICFHELVNRSLIQPLNIGYNGKTSGCRVHDTILDFLIYKSSEENFRTLLSYSSKPPSSRVRRLLLMGNEDQASVEQLDLSHARSLIAFGHFPNFLTSLVKSNALRVLDIEDFYMTTSHDVKDIGRFLQLRFLKISSMCISELPKEIGDLEYLGMLNVACTRLVKLPESVTRLQRLTRLFVAPETKFPDGIGNMKSLQVLRDINPMKQSTNFVIELGKLTNLWRLGLIWDTSCESSVNALIFMDKSELLSSSSFKDKSELLSSSLSKLGACNLTTTNITLNLLDNDVAFMDQHPFLPVLNSIQAIHLRHGQVCWITKWLLLLVNLESLNVDAFPGKIEQHDVDMIGSIPTLRKLEVRSLSESEIGPTIIVSGGFQRLHELIFYARKKLMFEAGAMPNLEKLYLYIELLGTLESASDGSFDFGIHHLSSLSLVTLDIDCAAVSDAYTEAAEGAFKSMADAHPNRPTLVIK